MSGMSAPPPSAAAAAVGVRVIALEGKAPGGRFWTAVVEPYPKPLCGALARALSDAAASRRLARLWDICKG